MSWISKHPIPTHTVTKSSIFSHGQQVLDLLKEEYGGQQMPIIGKKLRWKAPWPMIYGNTVACVTNRDGSQTISAMGRAALVTREILGPEAEIKLIGPNSTQYAIWQVKG